MRFLRLCLPCLALALVWAPPTAYAGFDFYTASTATQTISSQLVPGGSIDLNASGIQHFTIDTVAGTANVTSDFKGTDFLTPFGAASYNLYNTETTGTVTDNGGGSFTIAYLLLFELEITSGPLAGVIFETLDNALFQTTVPSIPFPDNTVFGDPSRPNDVVAIYLKSDPNGVLGSIGVPIGAPVGTSSNRVVTAVRSVPEPTAMVSGAIGAGLLGTFGLRKGSHRRSS